jgi:anti-sigma B factor antagonist
MSATKRSKDSVNSPPIHVTAHKVDTGETQVVVIGEIDLATYDAVDEVMNQLKGRVVLDLRNVDFMDSTGIRLILTHQQRLDAADGHLRLIANQGPVYKLMEIAGVVAILDVADSLHPSAPEPEVA